jgi:arabinofuranosyltransferase
MPPRANFLWQWGPLLLVLIVGIVWAAGFFDFGLAPFEDAAMLLRYAQHVAAGHGEVWNVGDAPVDGATDFGFMVMVAGLSRMGLSVEDAARALLFAAHGLTVALVYRIHLRQLGGNPWSAGLSALVVMVGPAFSYIETLFGAPVFALAGLGAYSHFLNLLHGSQRKLDWIGFPLAALLAGLIRPEGAILAIAMAGSLYLGLNKEGRKKLRLYFLLLFGLPGALYFAWHWVYFGYPLPNPFYIKGGGAFYPTSVKASFIAFFQMALVLLPLFMLAVWQRNERRIRLEMLAPLVVFAAAWGLMSNAMNYNLRFQYVLMPITWVVWLPVARSLWPEFELRGKHLFWAVPAALLMVVLQFLFFKGLPGTGGDGRVDLGKALANWKSKGYTMAVTEAGNLPFYSEWKSIDTWGLNDRHIAHQEVVDAAYLDAHRPALFLIHRLQDENGHTSTSDPAWARMTDTLEAYLAKRDYVLVAVFGRKIESTHCYYVRGDLAEFDAMNDLISDFPYTWHEDGAPAENFLLEEE